MIPWIIGGVAVAFGLYKLYNSSNEEEKREIEQKLQAEKNLWNNGRCPQCGKKWHVHWFYPKGSRGQYKHATISCKRCQTRAELNYFVPPGGEVNDISIK